MLWPRVVSLHRRNKLLKKIKKTIDKYPRVCYNKGTVRERKKDTSMKANRKNNANKVLTLINIFAVIVLAWIGVSTIEVISNNLDPNPTYAVWNIYNLIG